MTAVECCFLVVVFIHFLLFGSVRQIKLAQSAFQCTLVFDVVLSQVEPAAASADLDE